MTYQDFIKPELMILIPVLYLIGMGVKRSKIRDALIPLILGGAGVILAALYLFSTEEVCGVQGVFTAIFTALTQGVLCAAAAVYSNQIFKQIKNEYKKDGENNGEI